MRLLWITAYAGMKEDCSHILSCLFANNNASYDKTNIFILFKVYFIIRKSPIALSSFTETINKSYVYIDQIKHVYNLVNNSKFYFLSLQRCFGKYLLIDTLKQAFYATVSYLVWNL